MYSLADRLGMIVTDYSSTMVAMRDDRNSVVLFAGPEGRAYVNGRPVPAPVGGVIRADGMLFIPISYESAIREQMRGPVVRPTAAAPFPTPRPTALPVAARVGGVVLIDPGHGGQDPGAISVRRDREKTIVLDVARVVAERLAQSGVDVRMTRQDDRFIALDDRAALANRLRPNLFVSIHADFARNRAATGFTLYVSPLASRTSKAAADALARHLQAAGVPYRGRKEADFRVLVNTTCPAVLVELGYLSNPREAAYLASPAYRQQLGQAIANGIVDYLQGF
jgi:N-acetylmuramoyl-L-alanine amidase